MLVSNYGHATLKLVILLTICFGIQAECDKLIVYYKDEVIDTNSVCVKRYSTKECRNFTLTFDQASLPDGFPRRNQSVQSVQRPSYINLIGLKNDNGTTIYPGLSISWGSPVSDTERQSCFGYLVIWECTGYKVLCNLFQLNQTNSLIYDVLDYELNLNRVQQNSTCTVKVYSMPQASPESKSNPQAYVSKSISTPPLENKEIEPGTWNPHISYDVNENGTIESNFILPPPSFNFTRFGVTVVNQDNMNTLLYVKNYEIQNYSEQYPVTQRFTVNETGCYKIAVKVKENTFSNVDGMCKCWAYSVNYEKTCNTCSFIYKNICLNVTKSPDVVTTFAAMTPSVGDSKQPERYYINFDVLAGCLTGLLLILGLALLVVYNYRKNDRVRQLVRKLCLLPPSEESEGKFPPGAGQLIDESVVVPLTTKTVYIIYADDHQPHLDLVESFRLFLEVHCRCKVVTPLDIGEEYESRVYEWFISNITMADCIIFINSECAENLIVAHLKNKSYYSRESTTVEDVFRYGLKYIMMNKEVRERNVILVSFQGNHCQQYLQATEIHMLPENLPNLLYRIHNLNAKSAEIHSVSLPLQKDNVPNLLEGAKLYFAIQDVKDYEENHPDWFGKSFGNLILPSIDSGYFSRTYNHTTSVSTQDISETISPGSVFEKPNFAEYFDSNSMEPQALTDPTHIAHMQRSAVNHSDLGKNLSDTVTIYESHVINLTNPKADGIKPDDEMSVIPPEALSKIVCESYSLAFANINKNDELIHQYSQIPNNCNQGVCYELENVDPINITEVDVIPPENLSNIQVDSISSALLAINESPEAIREAAELAMEFREKAHDHIVILTNALSVVMALKIRKNSETDGVRATLANLASPYGTAVIQWILSHCDIHGNEVADKLAKIGGRSQHDDYRLSYEGAKTTIKVAFNTTWISGHPLYSKVDGYYHLARSKQVITTRLRSGHNRMNAHLFTKFKIGTTDKCHCGLARMTTEHVIMDCLSHAALRLEIWPSMVTLEEKLFGSKYYLKNTAKFIKMSGIIV